MQAAYPVTSAPGLEFDLAMCVSTSLMSPPEPSDTTPLHTPFPSCLASLVFCVAGDIIELAAHIES